MEMKALNDIIVVEQLPIIREQLHKLKARWEQKAADAEAMVCTEETIRSVKAFRAEMRKEFEEVEALRKQVKKSVLEPYEQFETVYKECVTNAFRPADNVCAAKILSVEADIKRRCEDGLRDYFAELCAVRHLDWLTYERAGIKVDMASAKAKTPTRLRKQLSDFVTAVGDAVDRIMLLDNADEIMVEFKQSPDLDAGKAICTVQERHRRVEEEREALDTRQEKKVIEDASVARVEALSLPVVKPQESTIKVSLVLYPTKTQFEEKIRPLMRQLKEICDMDGIRYE